MGGAGGWARLEHRAPCFHVSCTSVASSLQSKFSLVSTLLMCEYVYGYLYVITCVYAVVCIVEVYKCMDVQRYACGLKVLCVCKPMYHITYI